MANKLHIHDISVVGVFFIGLMCSWLVVLRIYVALAIFQPYHNLEAGDKQSLKLKRRDWESNPRRLAPQAKGLTTTQPLLLSNV